MSPRTTYEVTLDGWPVTRPPNLFARSTASSRVRLESSPVKTKARPARQLGSPSGIGFEPGAEGPASRAALAAIQLERRSATDSLMSKGDAAHAGLALGLTSGSTFASLVVEVSLVSLAFAFELAFGLSFPSISSSMK